MKNIKNNITGILKHIFVSLALVFTGCCITSKLEASTAHPQKHPQNISDEDKAEIKHFIEEKITKIQQINNDTTKDIKEKTSLLKEIFEDFLYKEYVARFSLGKWWRNIPQDTKKEYIKVYNAYLMGVYIPMLMENKCIGSQLHTITQKSNNKYSANVKVITENGDKISLSYILLKKNGKIKLVDIIVENISIMLTHKAEFNSIITSQGVDGLILKLKEMK